MEENKLYVGNISFKTTAEDLTALFSEVGTVNDVRVVTDRDSGRSRGFGFVEMSTNEEAQAAIEKFNGYSYMDREIVVNIAKPRA